MKGQIKSITIKRDNPKIQAVSELLRENITSNTNYFVFDSRENVEMTDIKDAVFEEYVYNTKRFNRVRVGDVFIYRTPKRVSKGDFYFYGGGVVKEIILIHSDGHVKISIDKPFKLINIIYEGEASEIKWTFKEKKQGSWLHFWNQYGMNKINYQDFMSLVGNKECIELKNYSKYNK